MKGHRDHHSQPARVQDLRKIQGSLRRIRMAKGVARFWRLNQLGENANARFLEALAHVQPTHQAGREVR
jgi:hypothetical protein